MSLSLRTKFIIIFIALGLFMSAATSVVFYVSFNKLIRAKTQSDLENESQEFADYVRYEHGVISMEPSKEWQELEHLKQSDYSRYIIVTDIAFRTLHKSENLNGLEFQSFHRFTPTDEVRAYDILTDSSKYFCVVYPIRKGGQTVGYVLAAENYERTAYFINLAGRTILISGTILLIVSVILAIVMANRVTTPLRQIEQMAGRIDLSSPGRRIELRDTEKEIANLSDSLNRLFDRLEKSFTQINEFSSNVSHELRTPLTILRGNIEVGLSKDRTPDEYVEILSSLLEETIHIIRIVDDLLLLARADANALRIQKEPVSLSEFCAEYSKDWEMICSLHDQPLVCRHEGDLVIDADKSLLYQLILNLVSNASKYSPGNKTIEIEVRRLVPENGFAEHAEITVTDQGVGIAANDLEHVFDRFYRVNKDRSRETGGSGLGLSICKMIAELHQGRITIESRPGGGTRVKVVFPTMHIGRS